MSKEEEQSRVLARYTEGPERLEQTVAGLDESDLDARVSPNGWTVRQVVHHIVDGDDVWKLSIKTALGLDDGEFTLGWYWSQSQDSWAEKWKYSARSVDVSLALFRANRDHILQLLQHVPDGWQRSVRLETPDGKTERVTVGTAIQIQADHAMHHIEQIVGVVGTRGGG